MAAAHRRNVSAEGKGLPVYGTPELRHKERHSGKLLLAGTEKKSLPPGLREPRSRARVPGRSKSHCKVNAETIRAKVSGLSMLSASRRQNFICDAVVPSRDSIRCLQAASILSEISLIVIGRSGNWRMRGTLKLPVPQPISSTGPPTRSPQWTRRSSDRRLPAST